MNLYRNFIRPVLFLSDPETVHHRVFSWLKLVLNVSPTRMLFRKAFVIEDRKLQKTVFGIRFSNPVGLAAGFDKDALLYNELPDLGFGFIEIGTLTPLGQPGNEKPRMFRLKEDQALINRMGFNNEGVKAAVERLKKRKTKCIIGGNIGKNKQTPNEKAGEDYEACFRLLYDHVDYFVVNVSSPNTPGLRSLQDKEPLLAILMDLQRVNKELCGKNKPKPLLLKIAPDLTNEQLDDIIEVVKNASLEGVIATNTTISREGLLTAKDTLEKIGAGGLSGKPLEHRSTEVIRYLRQKGGYSFGIIGVGGIHSPEDALKKLEAGADLIQLYTGFIYEGPGLVKRINQAILKKSN